MGTDKKKPADQNFFVSDKGTLGDPLTEGMDDSLFSDEDEESLVFKSADPAPSTPNKKGLSDAARDRFNLTDAYEMAREMGSTDPAPISSENFTTQSFENAALLFRSAASGGFKAAERTETSEPKEEKASFGAISGSGKEAPNGPSLQLSFGGTVPEERLPRLLPDPAEQAKKTAAPEPAAEDAPAAKVDTPEPTVKASRSKISFVPAAPTLKPKPDTPAISDTQIPKPLGPTPALTSETVDTPTPDSKITSLPAALKAPVPAEFKSPASGSFNAPASSDFDAPASGNFDAPVSGDFKAPVSGDIEIPTPVNSNAPKPAETKTPTPEPSEAKQAKPNAPAPIIVPTPAPHHDAIDAAPSQAGALASLRPKAQTLASLRQQTAAQPQQSDTRPVVAPPPKKSLMRRIAPVAIICSGVLLVGGAFLGALVTTGDDLRRFLGTKQTATQTAADTTPVAAPAPPQPPASDTVNAQLSETGMSAPDPETETSGTAPIVLSKAAPAPLPGAPGQLDADLATIARPALKTTDTSRPVTEGFAPASSGEVDVAISTDGLGLGTGPAEQPKQRLTPSGLAQPSGAVRASKNLGTVLSASPELRAPQSPALTPERPRPLVTTRLQDSVTQVAALSAQVTDSALPELNSGPDRILAMLVSNKPAFDDGTTTDLPDAHRGAATNPLMVILPNGPSRPEQALATTSPDAAQIAVWSAPDADGLAALIAAKITNAPEAWTPDLDFELVREGVDLVIAAKENTPLPDWATPGLRLVSVNGEPLEAPADLTKQVAEMHPDPMTGQMTLDLGVQPAGATDPRKITHNVGILRTIRLGDGTQLAARFDGRKWITAVTSAGVESELVPGDILLRDYGRKQKLTEAQSLEDVLNWARSEGLSQIEFAIVRNGALESGTLSIVN